MQGVLGACPLTSAFGYPNALLDKTEPAPKTLPKHYAFHFPVYLGSPLFLHLPYLTHAPQLPSFHKKVVASPHIFLTYSLHRDNHRF